MLNNIDGVLKKISDKNPEAAEYFRWFYIN